MRVIVDCDPGTDDAIALWLALASPELELAAITVAGGNVGLQHTLANALAVVSLARSSVPVHAGADRPLLGRFTSASHVHGDDGLGGVRLTPGGIPAPTLAADAIRALLRAGPATLVGIGPATNLALALMTEPALATQVTDIVLMSGARTTGNITPAAEFNAYCDPEALAVLLATGRPVRMATLELTAQALVTPARVAALRARAGGACLAAACDILSAIPRSARRAGTPLHDPCAVAWLLRPGLFTTIAARVAVECGTGPERGRTRIEPDPGGHATLLETLDTEGFFDLLGERLAALP